MDYEKKYEKLVDAVKVLRDNNPSDEGIQNWVNDNVPELKESDVDDEKIRKALISVLKSDFEKDTTIYDISVGDIIDWLEKQKSEPNWCHHKVDLSDCSEEYRKAYYDGWNNCNMQHSQCESIKSDVLKCLINGMKFYYEDNEEATWGTEKFSMKVKDILYWLKNQGEKEKFIEKELGNIRGYREEAIRRLQELEKKDEQKPIIEGTFVNADEVREDFIQEVYRVLDADFTNDRANQIIGAFDRLPTIIIQNPANKVEPKFREGDWVVYNNDICQIVKREEGCNKLVTVFGIEKELVNERNLSTARLWTITDAKDGDVLYYDDDTIVIFKDLYNSKTFHSYCHIEDGIFDVNKEDLPDWWEGEGFKPATKEQRDILFTKIKEAGYMWDSEKKELKNIGPKPAIEMETPEESLDIDSATYNKIVDECIYGGQNPSWSEEDERLCSCLIEEQEESLDNVKNDKYGHSEIISDLKEMYNERIDWLKSLKERIKPKWKPSEEQLNALHDAAVYVDRSMFPYPKGILMKLYKQLKKLK